MNYEESLNYIYHAKQAGAVKHGLINITELLKRLGNPEAHFPSVHVAGTNGKGSTCAFLESILRTAGYRTGLFTSPYLERFTERIRFGGEEIGEDEFAAAATQVREAADAMVRDGFTHPTFFELTTACCFLSFAERGIDIAVIETGLGGRTDATNVLRPVLSIITAIGIDHAATLGGTIAEIAGEKAGIIKPGVPCVLSAGNGPEAVAVIQTAAELAGSRLVDLGGSAIESVYDSLDGQAFNLSGAGVRMNGLEIKLLGRHQLANAAAAVHAAMELRRAGFPVTEAQTRWGLTAARWPGRLELLRCEPPLIIDGAHNPQGASALASAVRRYLGERPICLVMGAMADKDSNGMVQLLAPCAAKVIATLPPSHGRQPRPAEELAKLFSEAGVEAKTCVDWRGAMEAALGSGMAVVVAGSLYLAGAVRTWWRSVAGAGIVG